MPDLVVAEPDRLSHAADRAIRDADEVIVSAASVWELALLVQAQRIRLDRPVLARTRTVTQRHGVVERPLDAEVVTMSVDLAALGLHRDPADRFIVATAQRERADLTSKDRTTREFLVGQPVVSAVW
jgi:PIN domain nuclease of toxin-antitoxin system